MSPFVPAALAGLRVGFGFDIERLEAGAAFMLGGALFDMPRGLAGSGDGDALSRALIDALLSAVGLPSIETLFPEGDPTWHREGSYTLLSQTATALYRVRLSGILNVSLRIVAEGLDLSDDVHRLQTLIAEALSIEAAQVGITFGGNARLEAVGRGEALVVFATMLCVVKTGAEAGIREPVRRGPPVDMSTENNPVVSAEEAARFPITEEDFANLPERVKQFEKAVQSGLPPLPKAERPREGSGLIIYTDGASRGNPGPSAVSFVVLNEMGELLHEEARVIGEATNNQAEYEALIDALKWVTNSLGTDFRVTVRTDSELMMKQISGAWQIKDEGLKQKALTAMNLVLNFRHFEIRHVPREENRRADKLCNMALDA